MALAFLLARPTQRHALIKRDVVAYDGGLADHGAHAVVDEQAASNLSAGMNLNAGKQTRNLRVESCQEAHAVAPKPMAQVMRPDGMQARIADQDLDVRARGGIRLEYDGNVFTYRGEEASHGAVLSSPSKSPARSRAAVTNRRRKLSGFYPHEPSLARERVQGGPTGKAL